MNMTKRVVSLVTAVVMTLSVIVMATVPAFAQDYKANGATITVSYSGRDKKLSAKANGELFDEKGIVPGDRILSKVAVKNETGSDVTVRLVRIEDALKTKDVPNLYKYMTAAATVGKDSLLNSDLVNCSKGPLTPILDVAYGKTLDIDVVVTMPPRVGNEAQGGILETRWVFEVTMKDEPQTVVISVPSNVNSIESGVSDFMHGIGVRVLLVVLFLAFVVVAVACFTTERDEKRKALVECKAEKVKEDSDGTAETETR